MKFWFKLKKALRKLVAALHYAAIAGRVFLRKKEYEKFGTSFILEFIFEVFCSYYEKHHEEIQSIEYPEQIITKRDIMEMYRWIRKVRPSNYTEFLNINYDYKKQFFEFWGSRYQSLKYKINTFGELHITPIELIVDPDPSTQFQKIMLKLQNDLYALDSEKAQWILAQRKFFNI